MQKGFLYNNIEFIDIQNNVLARIHGFNVDRVKNDKFHACFIDRLYKNVTIQDKLVKGYKHSFIMQTESQHKKGIGMIAFTNNDKLYYQLKRYFISQLLKQDRKNKFLDKITLLKYKWWLTDSSYRLKNNIFN